MIKIRRKDNGLIHAFKTTGAYTKFQNKFGMVGYELIKYPGIKLDSKALDKK